MPDISGAIVLLKKPIEDIYAAASNTIKDKVSAIKTTAKLKALHKKLYDSQRIKTIWNTERPYSLSSFFYPVSILHHEAREKPIKLKTIDDLENNHNVIFGTVGQGKSILLRYLLGREMRSGARIPLLCELRNIENQSLVNFLSERFALLLGTQIDEVLFDAFAAKGKVSFLLDGFDEIDPTKTQRIIREIDDLSFKYRNCKIILSSRPDSDCQHLTNFHVSKIAPLSEEDLAPFYKKITRDDDLTKRLVSAIKSSPVKIRELICTPLLATLLAISYRSAQRIPLDFSEFYDELFQILLVRHDSSKLGWRRQRKTKLNDREMQLAFEAFCFLCRKHQLFILDKETSHQFAIDSIAQCSLNTDPASFLDDIKTITCLLVTEGKKLTFVHASVQEFFAARFIKTRPEPVAATFYEKMRGGKWQNWSEELLFLAQIDSYRSTKYYGIPDLEDTLKDIMQPNSKIDQPAIDRYLNGLNVVKSISRQDDGKPHYRLRRNRTLHTRSYQNLDSRIYSILFRTISENRISWRTGFDANPMRKELTYLQLAQNMGDDVVMKVDAMINGFVNSMLTDLSKMKQVVLHEEKLNAFRDI